MINGKKIQEKVCGYINKKKMLNSTLSKNNGKQERKRSIRSYNKGDNDYYCFIQV